MDANAERTAAAQRVALLRRLERALAEQLPERVGILAAVRQALADAEAELRDDRGTTSSPRRRHD